MKLVLNPYTETEVDLFSGVLKSPRVLALAIGLPEVIASLLRWRGTSARLLAVLVSLLGGETDARERKSLEISNSDLAGYLWPDNLTPDSAKNKCTRWIRQFEEDQRLSGALLIQRQRGMMKEDRKTGKKEFLTSRYSVRDFDLLAGAVAHRILDDCREVRRNDSKFNLELRFIVGRVLIDEFGCGPILPEMRGEEKKRLAEGKKRGQLQKRIEQAKRGEVEVSFSEILELSRPDRIEVLCGQFLLWGDKLLDEVEDYEDLDQLRWIVTGMEKKFGAAVKQTLQRRYEAERKQMKNRSALVA